jgi:hypothetical protein
MGTSGPAELLGEAVIFIVASVAGVLAFHSAAALQAVHREQG